MEIKLNITKEAKEILQKGFKIVTSVVTAAAIAVTFVGCSKGNKNNNSNSNSSTSIVLTVDDGNDTINTKTEGDYEYLCSFRDDNKELNGYFDLAKKEKTFAYNNTDFFTGKGDPFFKSYGYNILIAPSDFYTKQSKEFNIMDYAIKRQKDLDITLNYEVLSTLRNKTFAVVHQTFKFNNDSPEIFTSNGTIQAGDTMEATALYSLENCYEKIDKRNCPEIVRKYGKLIAFEQTGIGSNSDNITNIPINSYLTSLDKTEFFVKNMEMNEEKANEYIETIQMNSYNSKTDAYEIPKKLTKINY